MQTYFLFIVMTVLPDFGVFPFPLLYLYYSIPLQKSQGVFNRKLHKLIRDFCAERRIKKFTKKDRFVHISFTFAARSEQDIDVANVRAPRIPIMNKSTIFYEQFVNSLYSAICTKNLPIFLCLGRLHKFQSRGYFVMRIKSDQLYISAKPYLFIGRSSQSSEISSKKSSSSMSSSPQAPSSTSF